jgi:hypothetical protein
MSSGDFYSLVVTTGTYPMTGYAATTPPKEETEEEKFKRLMIWKNLKIKSIAVKNGEITIECEKGDEEKHIYFITIKGILLSIYDDKRNLLDSMNIPSDYNPTDVINNPWSSTTGGSTGVDSSGTWIINYADTQEAKDFKELKDMIYKVKFEDK